MQTSVEAVLGGGNTVYAETFSQLAPPLQIGAENTLQYTRFSLPSQDLKGRSKMQFVRPFLTAASVFVLSSHASLAEYVQIQLKGNVPAVFEATLIWEEANTAGCPTPCEVKSQRIKIMRQASGVGVFNADFASPATRLCLNGYGGETLIVDTVLIMRNGSKQKTSRQDRNVESNGRSGCSEPAARMEKAKLWIVNLE
jgi:hypothetical protein